MTPPLTSEQEEIIKKVYYNDHMYFGRDKLYKYLSTNFPNTKISRRQVMVYLQKQENYQRNLRAPSRKTTKAVLTKTTGYIQIDCAEVSANNRGFKYYISAIDVFTKQCNAVALKSLSTDATLRVMERLLKPFPTVSVIQSDNGKNFTDTKFKEYLDRKDIKQMLSKEYSPWTNGAIEKLNDTIKRLIAKLFIATGKQEWVKHLPKIIENINSTYSFSTKQVPNDVVNDDNAKEQAKATLEAKFNKNPVNSQLKDYSVGDKVRVVLNKTTTDKKGVLTYTKEIYTIVRKQGSRKPFVLPTYKLQDEDGDLIKGSYNASELQLVPQ
jgi:transposase InsO family protein